MEAEAEAEAHGEENEHILVSSLAHARLLRPRTRHRSSFKDRTFSGFFQTFSGQSFGLSCCLGVYDFSASVDKPGPTKAH